MRPANGSGKRCTGSITALFGGRKRSDTMIRILDVIGALLGLSLGAPLLALLWLIGWFDTGVPLFGQERVGQHRKPFSLLKFRTMRLDVESVPTHLVDPSAVTTFGSFLRRTKLDELPQLWNVLVGQMSLVGPRPCLVNQKELIAERDARGVFDAKPGITGLAQIQGIDMSTPELLAKTDAEMLHGLNVRYYCYYITRTLSGRGSGDRVAPKTNNRGW